VQPKHSAGESFLRRELSGPALVAARAAAVGFALVLLVMYLRWLPRWLDVRAAEATTAALGGGYFPYIAASRVATGAAVLSAAVWLGMAVFVFFKRSRDLLGIGLALSFLSIGVLLTDLPVIVYMAREDPWAPVPATVFLIANAFSLPWAYVFPDGRFVPRWTVVLAAVWVGWNVLRMVTPEVDQVRLGLPGILLNTAFQVSMIGAFAYRYVTTQDAVQRQQIKWLVFGGLVVIGALIVTVPPRYLVADLAEGGPGFMLRTATAAFLAVAATALPLMIAVAIFRQGLFNIDLLINRLLAYLVLTVMLAGALVGLSLIAIRILRAAIGLRPELVLLAAAVPTALAFIPVRARLLAFADRYVSDRTVRTLVFIDVVDSTARALSLGDRQWRHVLERFRSTVRRSLVRLGGREIDTAGDGFFVTFEGPDRAIRWAHSIVEAVRSLGLEIRAGAHVGEVEVHGHHVTGIAVHVAARVMASAEPGEVVVSQPLRDLVAGSEIRLVDLGPRALKGLPGEWRLFAVSSARQMS
jgi:class 3 adenylate cyclase